jgi:PPOX class probable F420-dependent enzyme
MTTMNRASAIVLSARERHFIDTRRIGHLATADAGAAPHVVPVCFGLVDDTLYITIDRKPKRASDRPLKRLGNILENPQAAIVFDHYDEDWRRLAWVMLRGRAEILTDGPEHSRAQALLQSRYQQLAAMQLEGLPVIAIRIERAASWGDLGP